MGNPENTEEKIIEAATEEFMNSGFDGARMRSISSRAGINKGLLHYYFKSKDALFAKVFVALFGLLKAKLEALVEADDHLFDKIRNFTSAYIDVVKRNPRIPRFIIMELNRNPERLLLELKKQKMGANLDAFRRAVEKAEKAGDIKPTDPNHLLTNMISMCIFPFIGRPMIQYLNSQDNASYDQFIEERKTEVANTLIQSISKASS